MILALVGSPRRGNSLLACQYISKKLPLEIVNVAKKRIEPCKACYSCIFGEECKIDDDVKEIIEKINEADFVLISSPVYWLDLTGKMKMLLDRLFMAERHIKDGKKGAIIYFYAFRELRGWASNTYNILLRAMGIEPIAVIPINAALPGEVFLEENLRKLDMLVEAIKDGRRIVLENQCPVCLGEIVGFDLTCPICGSKFDRDLNLIEKGDRFSLEWIKEHYENLRRMKDLYLKRKDELKALTKKHIG